MSLQWAFCHSSVGEMPQGGYCLLVDRTPDAAQLLTCFNPAVAMPLEFPGKISERGMITAVCDVCHFTVTKAQCLRRCPITSVSAIDHQHFVMCEIPVELLWAA